MLASSSTRRCRPLVMSADAERAQHLPVFQRQHHPIMTSVFSYTASDTIKRANNENRRRIITAPLAPCYFFTGKQQQVRARPRVHCTVTRRAQRAAGLRFWLTPRLAVELPEQQRHDPMSQWEKRHDRPIMRFNDATPPSRRVTY